MQVRARDSRWIQSILKRHEPNYETYAGIYKHIHANPELSCHEYETAGLIVKTLRQLSKDLEIHSDIGGTGVIAILRNSGDETILLRADTDGLPVKELTGLSYQSEKEAKDTDGNVKPVMHACGHDMHVTALLAAADALISSRNEWSGTIVFLFQPAEEKASGAQAMVDDGLYTKYGFDLPKVVLGQHVYPWAAGTVALRPGPMMAGTDGMNIRVFGRGGHGSAPHTTVDPVVLASNIVVRLQTIVSREIPPTELGVVTVGSIQAGATENVISDTALLKVNTRNTSPQWRQVILAAIKRIVRAECLASNSPREPIFEQTVYAPPTINDEPTTRLLSESFTKHFGDDFDPAMEMISASEDFTNLATAIGRPSCFWFFGGHDPADWEKKKREGRLSDIPSNHSAYFAPVIQPTLRTGTEAMVIAALTFLSDTGIEN